MTADEEQRQHTGRSVSLRSPISLDLYRSLIGAANDVEALSGVCVVCIVCCVALCCLIASRAC